MLGDLALHPFCARQEFTNSALPCALSCQTDIQPWELDIPGYFQGLDSFGGSLPGILNFF